jgi:uncharacterized protein YjbI with pentapeptide repeats
MQSPRFSDGIVFFLVILTAVAGCTARRSESAHPLLRQVLLPDSLIKQIGQGAPIHPGHTISQLDSCRNAVFVGRTMDTFYDFRLHTIAGIDSAAHPISVQLNPFSYHDTIAVDGNLKFIFTGPVTLNGCVFTPLKGSRFHDPNCWLSNLQFNGKLEVLNSRVTCNTLFSQSYFHDSVTISGLPYTRNRWGINFVRCYFRQGVRFNRKKTNQPFDESYLAERFLRNLYFTGCDIRGKLDLSGCNFDSTATLELFYMHLPDTMDFSATKFSSLVNLTSILPTVSGKPCEINLLNTSNISNFRMQYANFHLYFPDKLDENPDYRDLISSTYESLLNNFKKNGFSRSYKNLDIEYKLWQCRSNIIFYVPYVWWTFGYEKWHILLWTVGFLFAFTLYNYFRFDRLQAVYPQESLQKRFHEYAPYFFIPVGRRLAIVLLYTGLIFFKFSVDFSKINFKPLKYVFILILQYSIGLVCTGFLINWILKG